ncbi:efflux RND transporter periplasmic adaptor subunit [Methylobrevis albus]|uniref:Efflux RND transporter periplasmic adaptor subunit n=1 Tax=Methylobrevis albus TaxID=2793297 RepID=A0A931I174_9HYPH|nr:efflux RND transporter periplasmic adaptor subunit [Methylobrevis albus]MBH0238320.1 efflux RND transporter periplasmic adaptor subunit [Methylobrevis albus]
MAVWKQACLVLVVLVVAAVAWIRFDPAAAGVARGIGVPAAVVALVAASEGDAPAGGRPGAGGRGGPAGPIPVVTAAAVDSVTNDRVSAIGTAEALRTVRLFSRVTGMVTDVTFRAGETVEAGALLVALDDDAEVIARERADVTLADARAKVERYDRLAESRSLSTVERDVARSELAAAELALREAQLALSYREIKAPFRGVVGLSGIEVGDMINASTEITTLDDRSRLKVQFRIPEKYAALVALGQEATATTPSRPGETFSGALTAVGSRIEADSRTLVLEAEIENTADQLRPGMSFLVSLRFPGDAYPAVPALAVQWDREGSYVWRVSDNKVERVGVRIVERTPDTALIEGPIAAGDVVVQEGVQRLRPGVEVAAGGAPAAPDAAAPAVPRS